MYVVLFLQTKWYVNLYLLFFAGKMLQIISNVSYLVWLSPRLVIFINLRFLLTLNAQFGRIFRLSVSIYEIYQKPISTMKLLDSHYRIKNLSQKVNEELTMAGFLFLLCSLKSPFTLSSPSICIRYVQSK